MKVVRLEEQLVQEVIEWLKVNGHYQRSMSIAAAIRAALSQLIYHTPSLRDGRAQAAEILAKAGREPLSTVRGRVAKFAQTYDWNPKQDIHVPEKVSKALKKSQEELIEDLCLEIPDCEIQEVEDLEEVETFPDSPPWELMKRLDIGEIVLVHPLHQLVKWCDGDELKTFAVEAAFRNVPQALHKTPKIVEMAEQLYNYFSRWEAWKKENS